MLCLLTRLFASGGLFARCGLLAAAGLFPSGRLLATAFLGRLFPPGGLFAAALFGRASLCRRLLSGRFFPTRFLASAARSLTHRGRHSVLLVIEKTNSKNGSVVFAQRTGCIVHRVGKICNSSVQIRGARHTNAALAGPSIGQIAGGRIGPARAVGGAGDSTPA